MFGLTLIRRSKLRRLTDERDTARGMCFYLDMQTQALAAQLRCVEMVCAVADMQAWGELGPSTADLRIVNVAPAAEDAN
jgi:hypothetical protein